MFELDEADLYLCTRIPCCISPISSTCESKPETEEELVVQESVRA